MGRYNSPPLKEFRPRNYLNRTTPDTPPSSYFPTLKSHSHKPLPTKLLSLKNYLLSSENSQLTISISLRTLIHFRNSWIILHLPLRLSSKFAFLISTLLGTQILPRILNTPHASNNKILIPRLIESTRQNNLFSI